MKYRITRDGVLETSLSGFDLMNFDTALFHSLLNRGLSPRACPLSRARLALGGEDAGTTFRYNSSRKCCAPNSTPTLRDSSFTTWFWIPATVTAIKPYS